MWTLDQPESSYQLTRFLFLRTLGFVCLFAFLALVMQWEPLFGSNGLLPAAHFLERIHSLSNTGTAVYYQLPTLFWLNYSDSFMKLLAWVGLGLSALLLAGLANAVSVAVLWAIYLSFVQVGQIFYGYGWEILLLETLFLTIFLVPPLDPRPFAPSPPPKTIIWFYRWLAFRLMFGAGLIKLRGDACWHNLTCLMYHFETQPIPNEISWWLHQLPPLILQFGVLWNHFIELVVPFFIFGSRPLRILAAKLMISFQVFLIISGNLSFLNWLTIAVCIPLLDDEELSRFLPERLRSKATLPADTNRKITLVRRVVIACVSVLLILLSAHPVINMISPGQIMNTSFDPLYLVNTYGAFGSVGRVRHEIILEGTTDTKLTSETPWKEYEFPAKPGNVHRRPPFIAPYQPRLDWQIWFAAMSEIEREPWLVHLVYKLLQNDAGTLRLLANNPFPDRPPAYIEAKLYQYQFTRIGESPGRWWKREWVAIYMPPVALEDPKLKHYLQDYGLE